MIRVLAFIFILLPGVVYSQAYPDYTSTTVNDFADVLPPDTEAQLDAMLSTAKAERDLEMTVVTIKSLRDYHPTHSIETYAKNLFNHWGVGNAERNDGILMLVAIEDRKVRIALGAGYPAVFDGAAVRVIRNEMLPNFKAGRYATGILNGTREALTSIRLPDRNAAFSERWRDEGNLLVERAKQNPIGAAILGFLGLGGTALGGRYLGRRRPRKCPTCGRMMLRLGHVQEKQHLDHGQLIEERLASKDHAVWVCQNDGHVTTIGYPKWFSRHKSCPNCGYKAYETDRTTERHATRSNTGSARLDHHCKHCDHRATEYAVIPMITDNDSSYGGSGSSGGGGGGFGGGSSSGGGGSGSW